MSKSIPRRRFLAGLPALGLVPGAISTFAPAQSTEPLQHIVFGSCLDTHEHPMLDRTLTLPRDLFIFMGDNVYADKGGLPMLREKYALLKQSRFFQELRAKGAMIATWDDHDFGQNDGGSDYPQKKESQEEFWNWLDEPADSPRRTKEGVYDAHVFGPEGKRVQVILLDLRYFRTPLKRVPKEQAMIGGPYVPTDDAGATMLGEAQWRWLEDTLKQPAELRLIVSSIQFAAELHGGECWANLPHERKRLMDVLRRTKASGVVILSGDRHWCEFSRLDGPAGYPLYDFTSSAMTQKHPRGTPTPNKYRFLPETYHLPSVGQMEIEWSTGDAHIAIKVIDVDGQARIAHTLRLSELQPV
jgi:alkaline phosphatase D